MVNIEDPTHISIFVLSPATLFFFSLSHPTIAPHIVATSTFKHIGRIIDNSLLNSLIIIYLLKNNFFGIKKEDFSTLFFLFNPWSML